MSCQHFPKGLVQRFVLSIQTPNIYTCTIPGLSHNDRNTIDRSIYTVGWEGYRLLVGVQAWVA